MASAKRVTFYTANYSPYAHRVQIALDEAKVDFTSFQFVKRGRPEWYYQINPLGKVPAIAWGGPDVPPDQPSPESAKLVESLAILEFIAEVYPEAQLMPIDPIERAKARTFISIYENYVRDTFKVAFYQGQPADVMLQAIDKLQRALPPTGFAVGQYSIADIAVTPFLSRMALFLKVGLGSYTEEDGKKVQEERASERFGRYRQYIQDLLDRPSFKARWNETEQIGMWKNHPGLRGKALATPDTAPKSSA